MSCEVSQRINRIRGNYEKENYTFFLTNYNNFLFAKYEIES